MLDQLYVVYQGITMTSADTRLIFSLCISVLTAAAAPSLPTDCSVAGWTVPKPPDGAKLLQVQAVIRSAILPSMFARCLYTTGGCA